MEQNPFPYHIEYKHKVLICKILFNEVKEIAKYKSNRVIGQIFGKLFLKTVSFMTFQRMQMAHGEGLFPSMYFWYASLCFLHTLDKGCTIKGFAISWKRINARCFESWMTLVLLISQRNRTWILKWSVNLFGCIGIYWLLNSRGKFSFLDNHGKGIQRAVLEWSVISVIF